MTSRFLPLALLATLPGLASAATTVSVTAADTVYGFDTSDVLTNIATADANGHPPYEQQKRGPQAPFLMHGLIC